MPLPSSLEKFGFPPDKPGRHWSDAEANQVLSAAFDTSGSVHRAMFAMGIQKFGCESVVRELIQDFAIHVWKEVIPRFDRNKQSDAPDDQEAEDSEVEEDENDEADNLETEAEAAMDRDGEAAVEAAPESKTGAAPDIACCAFARWFWQSYYWFTPKWAQRQRPGFRSEQPGVPYEVTSKKPSSPPKIGTDDLNLEDWLRDQLTDKMHQSGHLPLGVEPPNDECSGQKPTSPPKNENGDLDLKDWLLDQLTSDEHGFYRMIYGEKLTEAEIGELLGVASETVALRKKCLLEKLGKALNEQPECHQYHLYWMIYGEKLTEAEIGELFGVVRETVSRRKGRLLDKLREALKEQPEIAAYLQVLVALDSPAEQVHTSKDTMRKMMAKVRSMTNRHRKATPKAKRDKRWVREHAQLKIDLDLVVWKADQIIHVPCPQGEELAQQANTVIDTLAQIHPSLAKTLEEVRRLISKLVPPRLREEKCAITMRDYSI
jgi:DNA-directed RNA polymerase specialized sigma24 family protein